MKEGFVSVRIDEQTDGQPIQGYLVSRLVYDPQRCDMRIQPLDDGRIMIEVSERKDQ